MKKICAYSCPVILHMMIQYVSLTLTTILMGGLDDEIYLVAWGLASMAFMLIGCVFAFSSCLLTFVAQAYGAQTFSLCGIYLNR